MGVINLEYIKNQSLMRGLSDLELEKIKKYLSPLEVESYKSVIEEADISGDIFFLIEGEMALLKWDESKLFQLPIGQIKPGDMFGEMSFLDLSPRSVTIQARKNSFLYKLSREALIRDLPAMQDTYNKIIANIALINVQRLRDANQLYLKTLRSSLSELQRRNELALLVVLICILLGIMNFLSWIPLPDFVSKPTLAWLWVGWIVLLPPVIFLIRFFQIEFTHFGLRFEHVKKTVTETPFIIAIGCLLVWAFQSFIPQFSNIKITASAYLVGLYFIYCFAMEFICRGVLQTSLRQIMDVESNWKAIGLTACLATFTSFFSIVPLRLKCSFFLCWPISVWDGPMHTWIIWPRFP